MTTTIYIVRHGETDWNRRNVFRGTFDIPLNENGRVQAHLTANALREKSIEAAYTSPLSRARETAHAVLQPHKIRAITHEGLIDMDYGEWTGKTKEEVMCQWPGEYTDWVSRPWETRPPGGNSLQEIFDTSFEALKSLGRRHTGGAIALFSHRVINKLLMIGALGLGLERFPYITQGNCCYNELVFSNNEFVIKSINNTSHITNMGTDILQADF